MQGLAKDLEIVLIVPIFERQAAGVYRNSAAIVDADGSLLGVYRKMHIPDDPLFNEKYYFTPGDATQDERYTLKGAANGFRVWKTRYASIGVLICWDQWYPEARADHVAARRRHSVLSDGDRVAPVGEGGVRRGSGRGVADDSACACDRERRLCREPESRGLRAGAGDERTRVLRALVHERPIRPADCRGGCGPGGARGDVRSAR